jgi:putative transposase
MPVAKRRAGNPAKGPVAGAGGREVRPGLADVGTCKINALMRADGYNVFVSTVERRCGGGTCYSPRECQAERRELAKTRKAAFAEPPTGANQVRQLDFTEFETITGGLWRIAGRGGLLLEIRVRLAPSQDVQRSGCHHSGPGGHDGGRPPGRTVLAEQLANPVTGKIYRIKLVTDNGGAFTSSRFAASTASRPELLHIRTRRKPWPEPCPRASVRLVEVRASTGWRSATVPASRSRPRATGRSSPTSSRTKPWTSRALSRSTSKDQQAQLSTKEAEPN